MEPARGMVQARSMTDEPSVAPARNTVMVCGAAMGALRKCCAAQRQPQMGLLSRRGACNIPPSLSTHDVVGFVARVNLRL